MVEKFQPPLPNRFLHWFFMKINPFLLSRGVTWIINEESWNHWKSIPEGSAYFIASKHAHYTDHFCIGGLAAKIGIQCLYVSIPEAFSEYWGLSGFVVRRLGGFPVLRGGSNIQATRYIVEALEKGEQPLVIFPEGELYFLNDVVTPLKLGCALFALEGAKAREKGGKPNSTYILPIGLKYIYKEDATSLLLEKLLLCEKEFYKKVQPGDLFSRVIKLMEDVQRKAERLYKIETGGNNSEERFLSLSEKLIQSIELEKHGKVFSGDLSDRGRRLMAHSEKKSFSYKNALFGIHCLDFRPGYLETPTQERLMETLRKLERIITGNENPTFPGERFLFIKVQPPLKVDDYLPLFLNRKTKQQALGKLTDALQKSMEESIFSLGVQVQGIQAKKVLAGIF